MHVADVFEIGFCLFRAWIGGDFQPKQFYSFGTSANAEEPADGPTS